jgi:hypothetical protein
MKIFSRGSSACMLAAWAAACGMGLLSGCGSDEVNNPRSCAPECSGQSDGTRCSYGLWYDDQCVACGGGSCVGLGLGTCSSGVCVRNGPDASLLDAGSDATGD